MRYLFSVPSHRGVYSSAVRYSVLLIVLSTQGFAQTHRMPSMQTPSGGHAICAKCEVPKELAASTTLTPRGEPGELMEISGTIYQADGKSPAAGVVMFVYHTDATGHYSPEDDPYGPRLRGWLRTGSDGHYSFHSIRPAPYPSHREPAHIHAHVWSSTMPEHFLPDFWFAGDPLIKQSDVERFRGVGSFSPIVKLTRGSDGIWHGVRDIRLDK